MVPSPEVLDLYYESTRTVEAVLPSATAVVEWPPTQSLMGHLVSELLQVEVGLTR